MARRSDPARRSHFSCFSSLLPVDSFFLHACMSLSVDGTLYTETNLLGFCCSLEHSVLVEPKPYHFRKLCRNRPRATKVNMAFGCVKTSIVDFQGDYDDMGSGESLRHPCLPFLFVRREPRFPYAALFLSCSLPYLAVGLQACCDDVSLKSALCHRFNGSVAAARRHGQERSCVFCGVRSLGKISSNSRREDAGSLLS